MPAKGRVQATANSLQELQRVRPSDGRGPCAVGMQAFPHSRKSILVVALSLLPAAAACTKARAQEPRLGPLAAAAADHINVSQALPGTDRRGTLKYKVKWPRRLDASDFSEYDVMKSIGITLNGPDSLDVQLNDLDPQSRIMCGLSRNGSSTESNSSVVFLPKFKRFHSISS